MRIDLHLHTNASDGALTPAELVQRAGLSGLDLIAITDHDTAAGVAPAKAEARRLMERGGSANSPIVIPGIEVSSSYPGVELHFLGYLIDHEHPLLEKFAIDARDRREERMRGMIDRLASLGIEVEYDDVLAAAGEGAVTIGRPHLARAMIEKGYVQSAGEAFERYLADSGPAFLPTELLTPRDAIELVEAIGGLSVWAHPPWEVVEEELDHFVEWGLQGIECYRPRNSTTGTRRLLEAAEERDLLVTGGSDWHGEWNGPLGTFAIGRSQIDEFLAEAGL